MSHPVDPAGPVSLLLDPPVAQVLLSDSTGRNVFSSEFLGGLASALETAVADPEIRVVVLRGTAQYFSAGFGTEGMLKLAGRQVREVWGLLRSMIDCPLPIVAAVEGHALGGGLLLALCCDIAVLSLTGRYSASFMSYGFTPGAGATYLLPAAMGSALGVEMLYTGRTYRGDELRSRGAGLRIVAADAVFDEARREALRAAAAPRRSIELLKKQLTRPVLTALDEVVTHEFPDHESTMSGSDVRDRIRRSARRPGADTS